MFDITPWNEQKDSEIAQRIYNAIFVSVCQICLIRTKRPGQNSTWINDLNHEHQKEFSKVFDKIQVVPLGPKRFKLSQINDYKSIWQDVQYKVNNQREETKNNDERAETLKEENKRLELEYENKTHNIVMNESTVFVQNEKKIKKN